MTRFDHEQAAYDELQLLGMEDRLSDIVVDQFQTLDLGTSSVHVRLESLKAVQHALQDEG